MFTVCVERRGPTLTDPGLVKQLVALLGEAAAKHGCTVPIYTFMPDHIHLLMLGMADDSDSYAAMVAFGINAGSQVPAADLQKDFYDRALRWFEGWETEAWYIARNPVRKGFANDPFEWPFTGAIGHNLRDVLGR